MEGCAAARTGTLTPVLHSHAPLSTLTPQLRRANTAAVRGGPYGAVRRPASLSGTARQVLYRDAPKVLQAVAGADPSRRLQDLQDDNNRRSAERNARPQQLQQAVVLAPARRARFAATAQAEGVRLPVSRRWLLPLLHQQTPSVASLGRWTPAAALRAAARRPVVEDVARPQAAPVAAAESFFGRQPCWRVVEQHSLCGLSGPRAANRNGDTWAEALRPVPNLPQVTREGGTGLAKGVAPVHQQRQAQGHTLSADPEDHFHTRREGRRAVRQLQQRVCRGSDAAAAAHHREQQQARRTGSRHGTAAVTAQAERHAAAAVTAGAAVEEAWATITDALPLFTPTGALNTRARVEGIRAGALPVWDDPVWATTRRARTRPQLLTFLDRTPEHRAAVPLSAAVRQAAVQAEGLRQRPERLREAGPSAAALRGVLLATRLGLALSGAAGAAAVVQVRQVWRQAWRASRRVACLTSVARMQPARQRRMPPGRLALKRWYGNGRLFGTGRRRQQRPSGLLGVKRPTTDWWELLRLSPEQLRQQLSAPGVAA